MTGEAAHVRLLTSEDVAREYGLAPRTARRWMARLHKDHGSKVVARNGGKYVTTLESLAQAFPGRPLTDTQARILAAERKAENALRECEEARAEAAKVRENQRVFRAELRELSEKLRKIEDAMVRKRGEDGR